MLLPGPKPGYSTVLLPGLSGRAIASSTEAPSTSTSQARLATQKASLHAVFSVHAGGQLAKEPNIEEPVAIPEACSEHKSDQKPAAPEAKPDSELAADVKGIKAWITNTAEPARKESIRREQINRDGLADVNNQCKDGRDKTQKLWIEKDKEHESLVKEITRLNKENRDLRTELAGKANRAKSTKPAKA